MGRIPEELRRIIAANIRAERVRNYPGRGGGKRCAEAFGVSPQQWSPWERGARTPDELRLSEIAEFFGVTVDHMRHEHPASDAAALPPSGDSRHPEPSLHGIAEPGGEVVWQLDKNFSGQAGDGIRLNISVNIVMLKEQKQEPANFSPPADFS